MKVIISLMLMLVTVHPTSADGVCGPLQRIKVQSQFGAAMNILRRAKSCEDAYFFWSTLFGMVPEARPLFTQISIAGLRSIEACAHNRRLNYAFIRLIWLLDEEDLLQIELARLRDQHAPRGLKPAYYKAMSNTVMTMVHMGGRKLCLDMNAWNACMKYLMEGVYGASLDY